MNRSQTLNAKGFRGKFGADSDVYKRYRTGDSGPRTSVGEWSDHEPGYAQSVDMRWDETKGTNQDFIGDSERRASNKIRAMTRRSAVTAASRYQWAVGRSAGKAFGKQVAAAADRQMKSDNQGSSAEDIAVF